MGGAESPYVVYMYYKVCHGNKRQFYIPSHPKVYLPISICLQFYTMLSYYELNAIKMDMVATCIIAYGSLKAKSVVDLHYFV